MNMEIETTNIEMPAQAIALMQELNRNAITVQLHNGNSVRMVQMDSAALEINDLINNGLFRPEQPIEPSFEGYSNLRVGILLLSAFVIGVGFGVALNLAL